MMEQAQLKKHKGTDPIFAILLEFRIARCLKWIKINKLQVVWEVASCRFLESQDREIPGLQDPAAVPNAWL